MKELSHMQRPTILSLAIFLAALLQLGCKPEGPGDAAADAKVARAKEEIKRAAQATADAAAAMRDQYADEMRRQLEVLDAKSAVLKERASKAAGQAKKDLDRKYEEAKLKHADAAKKLEELKGASAERWEKLKEGFGKALDDLKKVIE
jgi:hypothetical protein